MMMQPAPRPIYAPRPAVAMPQPAPRTIRGVSGAETKPSLTPARAVGPVAIPEPETLGIGGGAATKQAAMGTASVSIPSPESLGVGAPSR